MFNAQLRWDWNDIDHPCVCPGPRASTNDRADLWSSNVRFGVWSDANTGLFVVYNDIQGLGIARPSGAGRTLTVKYNYLFDLID